MKPKLAHVDVTSGSAPQISSESSEHSDGNKPQAAESREKCNELCFHFSEIALFVDLLLGSCIT